MNFFTQLQRFFTHFQQTGYTQSNLVGKKFFEIVCKMLQLLEKPTNIKKFSPFDACAYNNAMIIYVIQI